jgi:23S rRNA (uracil1939-C5)-methyltransferase
MSHCVHFGACGGCAVDDRAAIDKRVLLTAALRRAGFEVDAAPLIETPLRTRRRVDLAVTRFAGAITLGLHRARSDDVIDMTECVLLDPRIVNLLPPLRILLRSLEALRRAGSVNINWLDHGPDILLRADADVTGPDRTKMIAFARAQNAVRISTAKGDGEAELVAAFSSPVITLSGIAVEPAPGAFLQASAAGEAAIIAAVIAGLPKLNTKARIVELYAGIGTLSFALVQHARVEAYEGSPEAVAAHEAALRKANLAGRISIVQRDLARRPLMVAEMAKAAVVVLDPPYNGAGPQMKNLVASGVKRIIYVSCNPDALAADAFVLARAGYNILAATPIDQFPYSKNIESVVVFATP